jgi:hypothetical protein
MAEEQDGKRLVRALQSLPILAEDHYLRMQAFNLGLVDEFLMDAERQLLNEYIEAERTPLASATFVCAVSQLWIFGVYELLELGVSECATFECRREPQTRQPWTVKQMKGKGSGLSCYVSQRSGHKGFSLALFQEGERGRRDFVRELQLAMDSSERIFRRIEILRVHLIKHERHKAKGWSAFAPGYSRINTDTGDNLLPGAAPGNEVDSISRRHS